VAQIIRLLPFARAGGAYNMAADDVLLSLAAERGIASLRFYGWSEATVSLGYFQPAAARLEYPRLAKLPWVRRPSGGKTLVHHHELTYALALPAGFSPGLMRRMHERVILPALFGLGLAEHIQVADKETHNAGKILCFEQQTAGDLTCLDNKLVGSAQRKHKKALLQHGAILLAQSEYAPELPGIKELIAVDLSEALLQETLVQEFQRETGWQILTTSWTAEEQRRICERVSEQYATAEWNEKR
jgi:lipoate-protein ligase A